MEKMAEEECDIHPLKRRIPRQLQRVFLNEIWKFLNNLEFVENFWNLEKNLADCWMYANDWNFWGYFVNNVIDLSKTSKPFKNLKKMKFKNITK